MLQTKTGDKGSRGAGPSGDVRATCIIYTSILTLKRMQIKLYSEFGNCQPVYDFERLNQVGEGTYGVVYRARDVKCNRTVALKRMRTGFYEDGVSLSSLREVKILNTVNHRNVVKLLDVVVSRDLATFYLVLEYCEQDLANLLDNMSAPFTQSQTKCLMTQTLKGLRYLHRAYIVHRDLKMSNLLLRDDGCLKIADFGLARTIGQPESDVTPNVVSLWYRAPEVLLESRRQTRSLDIWATGCVLAELTLHRPFLPGKSQVHQLQLMIATFGTPTEKIWPGISKLPAMRHFNMNHQPYNKLSSLFPSLSSNGLKLLHSMFTYDPKKRASAEECLDSAYFQEPPYPCHESLMPSFPQHRNYKRQRR